MADLYTWTDVPSIAKGIRDGLLRVIAKDGRETPQAKAGMLAMIAKAIRRMDEPTSLYFMGYFCALLDSAPELPWEIEPKAYFGPRFDPARN